MPSTYSPNLRIELIAPGDQAGSWGGTTNTNLGTLIEQAISGAVVVAVSSANQALTALNGAADQSRNAVLVLTTSTTANFAVYAPPESKLYTISNTTAYTATIYNSTALGNTTAAGAGIQIIAGGTLSVWSDGTNFYRQNTYLDGVVAAADGSTAVTQAFGTNNTTLSTTAFVQAALQALHPVGSVYINATNATNPGTLLGFGTWTAFGAGRVPVGFNAADPLFDTAEETGGSKDAIVVSHTHTGSTASAGDHSHVIATTTGTQVTLTASNTVITPGSGGDFGYAFAGSSSGATVGLTSTAGAHTHSLTIDSTGSSGTDANLQPYITVYMWKRTA
jgi:hypothetical protein